MGQSTSIEKHNHCTNNQILDDQYKLTKYLAGGANGQVFMSCVLNENGQCILGNNVAIKKQFIDEQSYQYRANIHSKQALAHSIWAEIFSLQLCRILTNRSVCQNLPQWFDWYFCDQCKLSELDDQPPRLDDEEISSTNCVFIVNKLANDGDFRSWLKKEHDLKFYMNAFFQIFAGLYSLQKLFDMTHEDFHPGNILVHTSAVGGYWKYNINGKSYYIENLGFVYTLWDFGNVRIPNIIEPINSRPLSSQRLADRLKKDHETFISEIFYNDEHVVILPDQIKEFLKNVLDSHINLADIFLFFNFFTSKPQNEQKLATFKFDQNISLPKISI